MHTNAQPYNSFAPCIETNAMQIEEFKKECTNFQEDVKTNMKTVRRL